MTYDIVDELGGKTDKALELSFKKPGERDADGKALLTVTGINGSNRTAIVSDARSFLHLGRTYGLRRACTYL